MREVRVIDRVCAGQCGIAEAHASASSARDLRGLRAGERDLETLASLVRIAEAPRLRHAFVVRARALPLALALRAVGRALRREGRLLPRHRIPSDSVGDVIAMAEGALGTASGAEIGDEPIVGRWPWFESVIVPRREPSAAPPSWAEEAPDVKIWAQRCLRLLLIILLSSGTSTEDPRSAMPAAAAPLTCRAFSAHAPTLLHSSSAAKALSGVPSGVLRRSEAAPRKRAQAPSARKVVILQKQQIRSLTRLVHRRR